MKPYTPEFYKNRHLNTIYSAQTILTILLDALPPVESAVDIGCGIGTWLSVLNEKKVTDIQGVDGDWVDRNLLAIPEEFFLKHDLTKPIKLGYKYDLAISLEVAEHLPIANAKDFVRSLTDLSDFVLFSAAIPLQEGRNHINEQWQDYWASLFREQGFSVFDFIRRRIWNDSDIPVWYRQNILLFAKNDRVADINSKYTSEIDTQWPLSIVHPEMYILKMENAASLEGSSKAFRRALKKRIAGK